MVPVFQAARSQETAAFDRREPFTKRLLTMEEGMAALERFEALVLERGQGGKLLPWHLARSGRRTAVLERQWIGGACPNVNCMPSKKETSSANVAHVVRHVAESGTKTGRVAIDMVTVRQRKRDMVGRQVAAHLHNYKDTGVELILGSGRFVAPKTLEVRLTSTRRHSSLLPGKTKSI
jgi:pyruvate/2-oxoglutarate dehydrogenase complex dihydrolipoamide dehydrogenase (E3) component